MKLTRIKRNRWNQVALSYRSLAFVLIISSFILGGCGGSGGEAGVEVVNAIVPSQPLALTALCIDCEATVSWSKPECDGGCTIMGYNIYRGLTSSSLALLTNVDGIDRSFVDKTAEKGVEYFYAVAAINGVGESVWTKEAAVIPRTFPGTVSGVDALGADGVVNLSWTSPESNGGSDITSYMVYRGTTTGSLSYLNSVSAELTSFEDSGVVNGTTYYYTISAVNGPGEGSQCTEVEEMPHPEPTVSSAPLSLTAIGSNMRVSLSWSAPLCDGYSDILEYQIYRTNELGALEYITAVRATLTEYEDSNVNNGTSYSYSVLALNGIGKGQRCGLKKATPMTTPGTVSSLVAKAGDEQVVLTWTAPSNNGGAPTSDYNIYRGTTSENLELLDSVGSATATFTDTTADNDITYYYTVTSVNEVGEGSESSEVSATPEKVHTPGAPTYGYSIIMSETFYFDWNAPTNTGTTPITYYKIYKTDSDGNLVFWKNHTYSVLSNSWHINSRSTVYFAISAVNDAGEGTLSKRFMAWIK